LMVRATRQGSSDSTLSYGALFPQDGLARQKDVQVSRVSLLLLVRHAAHEKH
jgi:hypothetical protein